MAENEVRKSLEVVEHQGDKFIRIKPDDIDISAMTLVQKVGDVVAAPVIKGRVKIVTKHGKEIETINYAGEGDWVVYNISASSKPQLIDKLLGCDRKMISRENFPLLYRQVDIPVSLSSEDIIKLTQDIIIDNYDNADFSDSGFLHNLKIYTYIGKAVFAYNVPFNFVIKAPWGADQFINRGGMLIYDTNIQRDNKREMYGIEGSKNREPGEFEKTYSLGNDNNKRIIADTFKIAIRADRSPIAGIQFNNLDLARAYDRAHKKMPKWLEKFTS